MSEIIKTYSPKKNILFNEFLDHLKKQGFVFGIDQIEKLHSILNHLNKDCVPSELKFIICPVFASNAKQQEIFYREFDLYFNLFTTESSEPESLNTPLVLKKQKYSTLKINLKHCFFYGSLVLLIFAISFGILHKNNPSKKIEPQLVENADKPHNSLMSDESNSITANHQLEKINFNQNNIKQPEDQTLSLIKDWAIKIEQLNHSEQKKSFLMRHRNTFRFVVPIILLLIFLTREFFLFRRRKLVLLKQKNKKPPFVLHINIQNIDYSFIKNEQFYRTAHFMRQRLKSDVLCLDENQTINKTINSGGFPFFSYKSLTKPPEYLVLIDMPTDRDHFSKFIKSIIYELRNEGIFINHYFYRNNPMICFRKIDDKHEYLVDIQYRYRDCKLIIIGNCEEFLDPITGQLDNWVKLLNSWKDRVILTPVEPNRWGRKEFILNQKFIVLPANLKSMASMIHFFNNPSKYNFFSLKKNELTNNQLNLNDDIRTIQACLSDEIFEWLCACAVYPELHWGLTLHIGHLPFMPVNLINEKNLLSLTSLPWFQKGFIPETLRWQLINHLKPDKLQKIRLEIIRVLEKNIPLKDTFAHDNHQINLTVQKWMFSGKSRKYRKELAKKLKTIDQKDAVQDFTLLRLLESKKTFALNLVLPKKFHKLLFNSGIPLFGLKTKFRLMLASCLIAIVFLASSILIKPDSVFKKYPEIVALKGGSFMMGSAGDENPIDEKPRHQVTLSPFGIGKYEITNAQFAKFLNEYNRYLEDEDWLPPKKNFGKIQYNQNGKYTIMRGYEHYPVVEISWYGAQAYCKWLSRKSGLIVRLPTEAEWEYACRAGTQTAYSFGDDIRIADQFGWFKTNSIGEANNVGTKKPNKFGIFDMHGNVWEWCLDGWSDNYNDASDKGLTRFAFEYNNRVIRGGSYNDIVTEATSSNRYYYKGRSKGSQFIGLRVVISSHNGLDYEFKDLYNNSIDKERVTYKPVCVTKNTDINTLSYVRNEITNTPKSAWVTLSGSVALNCFDKNKISKRLSIGSRYRIISNNYKVILSNKFWSLLVEDYEYINQKSIVGWVSHDNLIFKSHPTISQKTHLYYIIFLKNDNNNFNRTIPAYDNPILKNEALKNFPIFSMLYVYDFYPKSTKSPKSNNTLSLLVSEYNELDTTSKKSASLSWIDRKNVVFWETRMAIEFKANQKVKIVNRDNTVTYKLDTAKHPLPYNTNRNPILNKKGKNYNIGFVANLKKNIQHKLNNTIKGSIGVLEPKLRQYAQKLVDEVDQYDSYETFIEGVLRNDSQVKKCIFINRTIMEDFASFLVRLKETSETSELRNSLRFLIGDLDCVDNNGRSLSLDQCNKKRRNLPIFASFMKYTVKEFLNLDKIEVRSVRCEATVLLERIRALVSNKNIKEIIITDTKNCKFAIDYDLDLNGDGKVVSNGKVWVYDNNELKFLREATSDDLVDRYWFTYGSESVAWIPIENFGDTSD